MSAAPKLLTVAEVADLLQCKPRTLEQWRQAKKGPTYMRVGHLIRYRQVDLDKWLAARVVEAAK